MSGPILAASFRAVLALQILAVPLASAAMAQNPEQHSSTPAKAPQNSHPDAKKSATSQKESAAKPASKAHPHKEADAKKPPPGKSAHAKHQPAKPGPATAAAPPPEKPAEPAAAAAPEKPAEQPKGTATGLPLPRFAALRSDEVNMRAGPGTRYPIEWVYKRRDLPVEIEREFEVWRLVRDPEGAKGWVHQATLTGRRSFIVTGGVQMMRRSPDDKSSPVAELKPGVIGRIRSCDAGSAWCRVQVGELSGYLKRDQVWGVQAAEAVN